MWTDENRGRYDRKGLRYPSDLTDAEWEIIAPLIPAAKRGGNKRTVVVREVVNGLMYILGTGCQWAALPKDLPPRSTVNDYFRRWSHDGSSSKSIMRCIADAGNWLAGTTTRRPRSSTAKASKARKKGGLDRSAGL